MCWCSPTSSASDEAASTPTTRLTEAGAYGVTERSVRTTGRVAARSSRAARGGTARMGTVPAIGTALAIIGMAIIGMAITGTAIIGIMAIIITATM